MASDVAVTVATTVAPLPVNNNNTTALAGGYTSADEREHTTASSVHESPSLGEQSVKVTREEMKRNLSRLRRRSPLLL